MPYRIAGVDVHKRMLAVVVADVAVEGEFQFTRRMVGTSPEQLRALAAWLVGGEVEEVVMESTAQYWRPVLSALERYWQPSRRRREGAGPVSGTLYLHRPSRIAAPVGGRKISRMPNAWSIVVWSRALDTPRRLARSRIVSAV